MPADRLSSTAGGNAHFETTQWGLVPAASAGVGLRSEMEAAGKSKLFDELKGFLIDGEDASYQELALRVGLSLGALKTTVHRLRGRYRDLLREEVTRTVGSPAEVDDEIRSLSASLQSTYR